MLDRHQLTTGFSNASLNGMTPRLRHALNSERQFILVLDQGTNFTFQNHRAKIENSHTVADILDLRKQVGTKQHGLPLLAQSQNQIADGSTPDWVNARSGLVQQQ